MRNEFFKLLHDQMKRDPSAYFLVADMGLGLIETIQRDFPDRFLNVGIAEQNMIGIASGLCNTGVRPFCYTISNFITERCFEQIRNDVCLHGYPVTIVGTSTGFDNGLLGATHQVIDDIGCMKILPGMRIYSPGSVNVIGSVFNDIMSKSAPAYVRIGKGSYSLPANPAGVDHLALDKDADTLVITHGTTLENCMKAVDAGGDFSVYCLNRIKPLDRDELAKLFRRYHNIVVIEDHFVSSGLYNSICQVVVDLQLRDTRIHCIATPEIYEKKVGTAAYFAERYGYSPAKIASYINRL
jgi:transketolase